ncbi:Gamma-glutamyltranspeptidase @ Glutathione hydrolase [hydrothermal vent metagenome]|uniref:Gamma-glutamyltranspeptidase @ Glutathione hydrolase n=1 Tax=hydrothermal vent metagenome TaxID=652676 RepID=A0A3B0S4R3_9ZZZZ
MIKYPLKSLCLLISLYISVVGSLHAAPRQMVVAANSHGASAGMEILKAGGSAVDAAIAVELVLGLVEPQSSGIGGGAFLMYYDPLAPKDHRVIAYDGREMAPAAATPHMFRDVIEQKKGYFDAVLGGRAVGTPGVIAMMYLAHQKHGKLPWKKLFAPAIKLADEGFGVSPRLHFLINRDRLLPKMKATREYFFNDAGEAWPVGHLLKNPEYADSLGRIAEEGPDGFYRGELAEHIVAAVNGSAFNPGKLTMADMENYQPRQREAICGPYRVWTICGMPPPSSGGGAVASILGILQSFDLKSMAPNSEMAVHIILEAERLGYADRDMYMADSDFVTVPLQMFTDPFYLAERAKKIDLNKSMGRATAGRPPMDSRIAYAVGLTPELPSTTHFSIVDQWGRMVSMTATVESAFGSRVMVGGFLLNNEMTDFSLIAERDGIPVANRIAPGKRPRSSMSPTFVLDEQQRVVMAIGSPGGNSIIAYVTQTIINVLDWGMGMQQAIDQPHFLTRGGAVYLEKGTAITALLEPLTKKGHQVQTRTINSGLHGIIIHYEKDGVRYEGGADKRREGVVVE